MAMFLVIFKQKNERRRSHENHARVHFSCVICIAAAFPTFASFHFLNIHFRIFLHPDLSHENGAKVLFSLRFSWFLGFDSKTMQKSAFCRSRRELSNAYFLAKFGFDTAENEPCQVSCPEVIFGCCQTTGREACNED